MINILLLIHVVTALLLIVVVLLQKSGSNVLSGLGGGAGNTGLISGTSAMNFLSKTTIFLGVVFMINSIVLANLSSKKSAGLSNTIELQEKSSEAAEPPAVPMAK